MGIRSWACTLIDMAPPWPDQGGHFYCVKTGHFYCRSTGCRLDGSSEPGQDERPRPLHGEGACLMKEVVLAVSHCWPTSGLARVSGAPRQAASGRAVVAATSGLAALWEALSRPGRTE